MVDFDVVDLGPADHPEPGDEAPDFTRPLVTDEFWEDRSLSSLDGPVLLVFTPMIGSFLAQYTWDELRDRGWDELETAVVGLTVSTPYDQARFLRERDVPFALFSDPTNAVAETYGVVHDLDGMAGVSEPRMAAFLIDEERTIEDVWVTREWPAFLEWDDVGAGLE